MALRGGLILNTLTAAPLANQKDNAMKNVTMGLEQTEEEILAFDVSDEVLEVAAGSEKQNFTLGGCSGLSVCPG
jgi:hypothetical protein